MPLLSTVAGRRFIRLSPSDYKALGLERSQSSCSGIEEPDPLSTTFATGGGRYETIENALAPDKPPSAVSEKVVQLLAPLLSKEGSGEVLWRRPTALSPPLARGEEKLQYLSGNGTTTPAHSRASCLPRLARYVRARERR